MSQHSFIYRNLFVYRAIMNVLYGGKYKARFNYVINEIKTLPPNAIVLELCFGDTFIAQFCKKAGYKWKGIDLNRSFVEHAQTSGYDVSCEDLQTLESLPKADAVIMIGSLYHFYPQEFSMLKKMFDSSGFVVISEPVKNFSSRGGLIGYLARRSANAGKGNEKFRYDQKSFLDMIKKFSVLLNFNVVHTTLYHKDIIVKLLKNGN